jgi:uncharacterized protein (TIGR02118 family)
MVKFMMMFHRPIVPSAFETAYNDLLALVERMPDVARRQVVDVIGSPVGAAAYHRFLEVYYENQAQMEASLRSPAGQEAGAELVKRFPKGSFETMFAEVYEEAGGSTPTA